MRIIAGFDTYGMRLRVLEAPLFMTINVRDFTFDVRVKQKYLRNTA